jgi:transposase
MARYKSYDYSQLLLIPVDLKKQVQPGTLEYTINDVVNNHIDTTVFDTLYKNDDMGAPAYDPAILLKIILFAYSSGIITSCKIA